MEVEIYHVNELVEIQLIILLMCIQCSTLIQLIFQGEGEGGTEGEEMEREGKRKGEGEWGNMCVGFRSVH